MGGIHSAQGTENTRGEQTGLGCGETDPGRLGLIRDMEGWNIFNQQEELQKDFQVSFSLRTYQYGSSVNTPGLRLEPSGNP